MNILTSLRHKLDSFTSYRVVLFGLDILIVSALALSALDIMTYSTFSTLLLALLLIGSVCFIANVALAKFFKIPFNYDSPVITAAILFFVLGMPTSTLGWLGIAFASLVAIASKYIVTWRAAHIFNPAAFGVIVVDLLGVGSGSWWIASEAMFIPMLLVGFLVLLKIRRFELFGVFALASLLIILLNMEGVQLSEGLITAFTLFPLLFLGTIMLTEPSTMPSTYTNRLIFGAIVGLAFGSTFDLGFIASSPHLALLLGNAFAAITAFRASTMMTLVEKKQLTPTTYSYAFNPDRPLKHVAGQYMDFTLAGVRPDLRMNRRTFTIASAPTNELIKIGVKFFDPGSQFKSTLGKLKVGDKVHGSHVAGDFTLPKNTTVPVVFIAGGVGVTPFIAMFEQIIADKQKRSVTLFYFVRDEKEVAFADEIRAAKAYGVNIVMKVGQGQTITANELTDVRKAHYYISGPPPFVDAYKQALRSNKVANIHVDFFSGY